MRSSLSFLRGGFIRLRVERRKKKKKTLYNIRRPCSRDEKTQWGFGSGDALHANSFMHSEALCSLMKAELINLFLFSRTFPHPPHHHHLMLSCLYCLCSPRVKRGRRWDCGTRVVPLPSHMFPSRGEADLKARLQRSHILGY